MLQNTINQSYTSQTNTVVKSGQASHGQSKHYWTCFSCKANWLRYKVIAWRVTKVACPVSMPGALNYRAEVGSNSGNFPREHSFSRPMTRGNPFIPSSFSPLAQLRPKSTWLYLSAYNMARE